jgi:hypothetical protein
MASWDTHSKTSMMIPSAVRLATGAWFIASYRDRSHAGTSMMVGPI